MESFKINIKPIEIWGGAEYSFVRTGEGVNDQLYQSGHEERFEDLNLFSELGIKTVRYPLLWEKYVNDRRNFIRIHEKRLNRLNELGITPVAGLLHHGSGPYYTDLYDQDFPDFLADFALTMAQKFPWLEYYTPVNEPLTTARFSGLYGVWYPHRKDDHSFAVMLLNQLKGIKLSMMAARSVNPLAKLVQTEDLSKTYSTRQLQYQADFENQRRWLTYDLLLGKVGQDHPMWAYLIKAGIKTKLLEYFLNSPVEPAICGFNYYVTSERYLDHRTGLYPEYYHGGNGLDSYVDIEAARAETGEETSVKKLLMEAWLRYNLPMALTEVHIACTREEQLRWFWDAYMSAVELKDTGVNIKAVTAWSFFGSYDWDSLLCVKNNNYENGIFDVRSGTPRPTALAGLIRSINMGEECKASPLLETPGWWKRPDRLIFNVPAEQQIILSDRVPVVKEVPPLLIIGTNGSLGKVFARECRKRGIAYCMSDRKQMDIASEDSVRNFLKLKKPWGVINTAGFTRIDEAERASDRCFRENTTGPVILAEVCGSLGIKFMTFSTDQVFNGKKKEPYIENDITHPLNLYGLSKKLAEEKVLETNPETLIIRSGHFFNPWHEQDFLKTILLSGKNSGQKYLLASDIFTSPVYAPDLAITALDLFIDGEKGVRHLSNEEEISSYDFIHRAFNMAGINDDFITPVSSSKLGYAAVRPLYSVLKTSYGIILPVLSIAMQCFLDEINQLINQTSL